MAMEQKPILELSNHQVQDILNDMGMLNTPIFKRKIGNETIIKLIEEICQEMEIKRGI